LVIAVGFIELLLLLSRRVRRERVLICEIRGERGEMEREGKCRVLCVVEGGMLIRERV
jgi:hypothetical protein